MCRSRHFWKRVGHFEISAVYWLILTQTTRVTDRQTDGRTVQIRRLAVFTAPRIYASAVLGVVILSVRPSVRLSVRLSVTRCLVSQSNNALRMFPHRKGNHSSFLTPTVIGGEPLSGRNLCSKWPIPSKNADFDRFPLITSQP